MEIWVGILLSQDCHYKSDSTEQIIKLCVDIPLTSKLHISYTPDEFTSLNIFPYDQGIMWLLR